MGKHKKEKRKKEKNHKHKKEKKRKSSSESSSEEEWVEKPSKDEEKETPTIATQPKQERENWLDMSHIILSSSTSEKRMERQLEKTKKRLDEQYDPSKCSRELNPYWKDGGSGLPSFKKPSESLYLEEQCDMSVKRSNNWKKTRTNDDSKTEVCKLPQTVDPQTNTTQNIEKSIAPSNLDPNVIAAKLVRAEIMGNAKLVEELKLKLEEAKLFKQHEIETKNDVILTQTDSKGYSRPLKIEDNYGTKKKRKIETHTSKERTSYYADDDKYSLKQMFEAEKYNTADSSNREFAKIAANIRKNDSLSDLFVDKIRETSTSKDVDSAINQHEKINKSLDRCSKCLQSENMLKHLMIEYNDNCYLSLPNFEPLVDGHCLISTVRHVSCSVQLDENEWSEINNLRLKIIEFFAKIKKSVVFFEIAKNFNKYPHMVLECIPIPDAKFNYVPIYFKKAIEESETEWSHNKKLISLKNKDVRKAIPKGLPYFFVNFGMNEGFAHVIEDQNLFPNNFAQEIIGGMLDIHHSKWRKPKKENFEEQKSRVSLFNKYWKT